MDGDGSESANSSGVSISGLLSCEMEYKTELCELVSEFMPDVILLFGNSGGGKAKSGIIVIVIQVVGSSWAKKIIILRLKSSCMWLFYNLFIWIVHNSLEDLRRISVLQLEQKAPSGFQVDPIVTHS